MAISSSAQYEVRTTGSDNNGGGFIAGATGTDFSQQDAPQFSGTDLASTNGNTGSPQVTSATHNFVATDVGNLINVSAGTNWTAGCYQIVSVAANAATLDRAVGTAASLSSGTWAEGGGFATIGKAVAVGTNSGQGGTSFGGVINIKSGTYTVTSAITPLAVGLIFCGYNTTHGDNGTPPLITTSTNSTNLFSLPATTYLFDNLSLSNTAVTPAIGISSSSQFVGGRGCTFSGFTNALNLSSNIASYLLLCEIKNCTAIGLVSASTPTVIEKCWIHGNAGDGTTGGVSANQLVIVDSTISGNTGRGVTITGSPSWATVINSNITGNTTDGVHGGVTQISLNNSLVWNNGAFGVSGPGTGASNIFPFNLGRNNAYGSNTSGDRSGWGAFPGLAFGNTSASFQDGVLTGSPFQSSTNFALNATAGAGAVAAGKGDVPVGSSSPNSLNMGAIQNSTGGSPAGALMRTDMSGGMFG